MHLNKLKFIATSAAILIAGFLAFELFASPVKAAGENYCKDKKPPLIIKDLSEVDIVSKSPTNRIKKGDSFVVLIQNFNSDYDITYIVDILKQDKSVARQKKTLAEMSGIGKIGRPEFSTSKLDPADYTVKVKLYHETGCLLKMETKPIEVILTEDNTTYDGVEFFDKGDVKIGSPDKQIKAGGVWRATIENNFTDDFKFEIKVNDLKTGNFLTKTAGTIQAGDSIGAWATIMTPGEHTVEVNIMDSDTAGNLLYTQRYRIIVTNPTSGKAPPANEPAGDGGHIGDPDNSQPTTNSDGDGIAPTLGKIFDAIFPGGKTGAAEANLGSVGLLVVQVTNYALSFAGIVAFVMVLWAARALLNSYGSEESFVMAKKTLIWALVGLLVILTSKGLLNWIVKFFTLEG